MNFVNNLLNIEKIHGKGLKGEGITIVIIDTGISPHKDFSGRILKFYDIVSDKMRSYDNNGHGSHIAGICAGDGISSNGKYRGICPKANIVAIKLLDKNGKGREEDVVKAANWIIRNKYRYNIDIVNISFGTTLDEGKNDRMINAVEKIWDAGVVVVAAAGNNGPEPGTVTAPGICDRIITVGALDDKRKVYIEGRYINDYSGAGDWSNGMRKPDIIAPATMIKSCKNSNRGYVIKSGTSMAAPIVTGCAGLLLCANPGITNTEVKEIIRKYGIDRGFDRNRQGFGMINPCGMLGI